MDEKELLVFKGLSLGLHIAPEIDNLMSHRQMDRKEVFEGIARGEITLFESGAELRQNQPDIEGELNQLDQNSEQWLRELRQTVQRYAKFALNTKSFVTKLMRELSSARSARTTRRTGQNSSNSNNVFQQRLPKSK